MPAVAAPPLTTRVFISHYSREGEGRFAGELARALEDWQIAVTVDQTADNGGDPIQEWIRNKIAKTDVLVYVISPGANASMRRDGAKRRSK